MSFLDVALAVLAVASCVLSFFALKKPVRRILASAEGALSLLGAVLTVVFLISGSSLVSGIGDAALREWAADTRSGTLWILLSLSVGIAVLDFLAVLLTGSRFAVVKRILPPVASIAVLLAAGLLSGLAEHESVPALRTVLLHTGEVSVLLLHLPYVATALLTPPEKESAKKKKKKRS